MSARRPDPARHTLNSASTDFNSIKELIVEQDQYRDGEAFMIFTANEAYMPWVVVAVDKALADVNLVQLAMSREDPAGKLPFRAS